MMVRCHYCDGFYDAANATLVARFLRVLTRGDGVNHVIVDVERPVVKCTRCGAKQEVSVAKLAPSHPLGAHGPALQDRPHEASGRLLAATHIRLAADGLCFDSAQALERPEE